MIQHCPRKDVCGSCAWSHIPYDKQLRQKLRDINGSFALKKVDVTCDDIVPSPVTEHYRNRMDFVINFQGLVGLREKGKWWRVIDDHTCFLADEKIEHLFHDMRDWTHHAGFSYFDRKSHEGFLRYAVIRSTTLGQTMITLVTGRVNNAAALKTRLDFGNHCDATTTIWAINHTNTDVSFGDTLHTLSGPGYIEENINGFAYRITPNAFFQTNPHGAALLQDTVVEFAGDVSDKTVMDLYCGSGFFTIPFAQKARRTIGVEVVPEAIADARVNAERNNAAPEFFDAKTEDFDWKKYAPDVLIVDPPRSGMHDRALQDIIDARTETVIYISCNYKNFAREMVALHKYYRVSDMRAIDMFPHTPHVELVAKLVRRETSNM